MRRAATTNADAAARSRCACRLHGYGKPGAHGGIALATGLAGIFNAWLLWRYLRRDGLLRLQPGWRRHLLRIAMGCVAMTAVVLGLSRHVGDWTAIADPWVRVGWLLAVVAAGALAYGLTLIAMGLRPRDLRH